MQSRWVCLFSLFTIALLSPLTMRAQQQVRETSNGIVVTSNGVTLEVTALQDDKLRVREWRSSAPEDASWAVLPASRSSRVTVVPDERGFHTQKLSVKVDDQLHLVISDLGGHVLQEDARPTEWSDESFKIYSGAATRSTSLGLAINRDRWIGRASPSLCGIRTASAGRNRRTRSIRAFHSSWE